MDALFNQQQNIINHFFDNFDHSQINLLSDTIQQLRGGSIIMTAVGKSANISKNIVDMFNSISIKAIFLDPTNALHGDLGIIQPNDILILFSKSAQTMELINLIPIIKASKPITTFLIHSNHDGQLVKLVDHPIYLPINKELCPLGMAPISSSIIQLIFGNTLVAHLMQSCSKQQYALNHPAGQIGKRLTIKLKNILKPSQKLSLASKDDLLINKISDMASYGNLIVVDPNDQILGIFTDGDLRRAIHKHNHQVLQLPMQQLINHNPITINHDQMAIDALQMMEDHRIKEILIVDDEGSLVGMTTMHDLILLGL